MISIYIVQQLLYLTDDVLMGEMRVFDERDEAEKYAELYTNPHVVYKSILEHISESPRAEAFLESLRKEVENGEKPHADFSLDLAVVGSMLVSYEDLLEQEFIKPVALVYKVVDGLATLLHSVDPQEGSQ